MAHFAAATTTNRRFPPTTTMAGKLVGQQCLALLLPLLWMAKVIRAHWETVGVPDACKAQQAIAVSVAQVPDVEDNARLSACALLHRVERVDAVFRLAEVADDDNVLRVRLRQRRRLERVCERAVRYAVRNFRVWCKRPNGGVLYEVGLVLMRLVRLGCRVRRRASWRAPRGRAVHLGVHDGGGQWAAAAGGRLADYYIQCSGYGDREHNKNNKPQHNKNNTTTTQPPNGATGIPRGKTFAWTNP